MDTGSLLRRIAIIGAWTTFALLCGTLLLATVGQWLELRFARPSDWFFVTPRAGVWALYTAELVVAGAFISAVAGIASLFFKSKGPELEK